MQMIKMISRQNFNTEYTDNNQYFARHSNFTKKNKLNEIKFYRNILNSLFLSITKNLNSKNDYQSIKVWIGNQEMEFLLEYIKLVYTFCILEKDINDYNFETFFSYKFQHDPDNISIKIQPKIRNKKWKYYIYLEHDYFKKVKMSLSEDDLILFLKSIIENGVE